MDLVGQLLSGRYQIEVALGAGGMGSVYRARDGWLERSVVVKTPHDPLARQREFRLRFQREIKSLVRFAGPNVVRILDVGEVRRHRFLRPSLSWPYYVSEYMAGGDLQGRIERENRLSPLVVAAWLEPIATALDTIHQAGFVHRDVKPGNILFDLYENPYLSDFGIARTIAESPPEDSAALTSSGVVVGSPWYMAPECLYGAIGPECDQYSLATSVYEAVNGHPPHAEDDPDALMRSKAEGVWAAGHHLPKVAEDALRRALSPSPTNRFASCREFAKAFRRGVEGLRTPTTPPAGDRGASSVDATIGSAEAYRSAKRTSVLTVLFVDLVGSTERLEQLGDARYQELLEGFFASVEQVVTGHSGSIVERSGDAALVVFAEPSSAVLCALDLVRLEQVRVGIDMGQVSQHVDGEIVARIFGRHVHRAQRIQSVARPGQIVASFQVYDCAVGWLVGQGIDWVDLGDRQLKGFSSPIGLFEPVRMVRHQASGSVSRKKENVFQMHPGSPPRLASLPVGTRPGDVLPTVGTPLGSFRAKLQGLAGSRSARPAVLWVDDHPENNAALVMLLKAAGLRVERAESTRQALEALGATQFDVVITDMGRGDEETAGLDLLRWLRESRPELAAIVFTSPRAAALHGSQCLRLGALGCSYGTISLLDHITRALDAAVLH